ncbi:MAG: response regulator [Chromatiales bacterium]|nr:response regulator [Zoogloeaceae bacterium]MCP5352392.1 response regulator [Chromatiales bacterium]
MSRDPLRRILYVDDDESMRAIIEAALGVVGRFSLRGCASGAEAIPAVSEYSPQLVLLDVLMPTMTGPEILERLRAAPATRSIPVMFMTGVDDTAEIERLLGLDVIGVIRKPVNPSTLAAEIEDIWSRTG